MSSSGADASPFWRRQEWVVRPSLPHFPLPLRPQGGTWSFAARLRLGGFVIHGNNRSTLGACLDGLLAVCDEVVAVDSQSTDGSADLVKERGVRARNLPWRGYGAARAQAVQLLSPCDYVFFLDADEWLEDRAISALRAWKQTAPTLPVYTVQRRNWANLPTKRFLFFTDTRARLVRKEHALWTSPMVVHEALPRLPSKPSGALIDHVFATSVEGRSLKDKRYALLWALRAASDGRRPKNAALEWTAHLFRNLFLHRALFRGGAEGARLSVSVSAYHAQKHQFLRAVQQGDFAEFQTLYREGRYEELFQQVATLQP